MQDLDVIFGTRNPTKVSEGNAFFAGTGIHLISMDEAGIEGSAIEGSKSLMQNAANKALFAHKQGKGRWAMAEDAGLFIDRLGGEPGVISAEWGGKDMPWQDRTAYCLRRMRGIIPPNRTAMFRSVVAVMTPVGERHFFHGEIGGTMLGAARCAPKDKMPYSPLFVPIGQTKCWAEMTDAEENAISHRGQAFRQALEFMQRKMR